MSERKPTFQELVEQAEQAEQEDQPSALELLRAALVDSAGLDDIPDPEPLIGQDILFKDSLNWLVGKPGCGKSFIALDMAGCVATGEMWQGYPAEKGCVLYLVAEGVRGTKKRVRAWEKAMGRQMDNVRFLPVAVQSKNAEQWNALVELAREIKPALIVVDTQARVTVGVEENSNTEMGEFVHQAEKLRMASSACVVLVHHTGGNSDRGRGATTLDGAMSTIMKVTKDEDRIDLECAKNKDGTEWPDITLRVVPMADSVVLAVDDGLRRPQSQGVSSAAMKTARAWWETHENTWVGVSALADVIAPKTTFYRHRAELRRAGLVETDAGSKYPRFRLVREPSPDGQPVLVSVP